MKLLLVDSEGNEISEVEIFTGPDGSLMVLGPILGEDDQCPV